MSKVLVLYYSAYGHIEAMAKAVAEGAREKRTISSWTKTRRSLQSTTSRIMMRLSSEPAPGLDASRHRWLLFWTRREACGCVVLCTEKWAALSVLLAHSMAAKR